MPRRPFSSASTAAAADAHDDDADDATNPDEALIRSYAEKRQTPVSMHVLMQTGYGSLLPPHLLQSAGARSFAEMDPIRKQEATVLQARSHTSGIAAHTHTHTHTHTHREEI